MSSKLIDIEFPIPIERMEEINTETYKMFEKDFEELFEQILETGEYSPYEWSNIRPFILFKMQHYCVNFYKTNGGENLEENEYLEILADICDLLKISKIQAPFTLQRICELISYKNPYSSAKLHLNAIFKLVNIYYNEEDGLY